MSQMSLSNKIPVVCAGGLLDGHFLDDVLHAEGLQLQSVILMDSTYLNQLPNTLDSEKVICIRATDSPNSMDLITGLLRNLKASGVGLFYENSKDHEKITQLCKDLLLTGFTEGISQPTNKDDLTKIVATKPVWSIGTKMSLSLKPKAGNSVKTWTVALNETDEMIDDEDLLMDEDKIVPVPVPTKADDCEVGKTCRKACKNCSCGRAEAEAAGEAPVKLTAGMLENPTSACGNCYLGDAFRCAGCPYKGLPAFQAGKKIELTSDFLTADA